MHIEQLISTLWYSSINYSRYDASILSSFASRIANGSALTEKQAALAIRILGTYNTQLSAIIKQDITPFLLSPTYSKPLRAPMESVDIVDNNILLKFPYNEDMLAKIREYKSNILSNNIVWDGDNNQWVLPLNESNIQFISSLCNPQIFKYNEEFSKLASQCVEITQHIENYAPMLVSDGGVFKIINAPKSMPAITATDIIEAVFQARNVGVTVWDNNISEYLTNSHLVNTKLLDFFEDRASTLQLTTDDEDIETLKTILKHSFPSLFIIPGGSELKTLKLSFDILRQCGVEESEMSVLFRLSSDTGKPFNEFVREHCINNSISEKTKIVFISGKLPKPLLKSKIDFSSVINLGFMNAHYTIKEYIKGRPNNITVKRNEKGLTFAGM